MHCITKWLSLSLKTMGEKFSVLVVLAMCWGDKLCVVLCLAVCVLLCLCYV